jgi:hypothetical protein
MLKCALALLVVAAAIDATQAASHSGVQTACDAKCEADFDKAEAGGGRERREGHAAVKASCLATCQTDFDIADAKETCDAACQNDFDNVGRSRRADHAFVKTLCEAKCTGVQDVSLAAQAKGVCGAGCQAAFDLAEAGRSRRAAHAMAQGTCDAGCATEESTAKKTTCDTLCDAEFARVQSKEDAAAAAAATAFCTTYDTTCAGEASATAFAGADAAAKKTDCESWYVSAEAGTADDKGVATRGCYEYHLGLAEVDAAGATAHCKHARGDEMCTNDLRNRREGHSALQTTCKEACTGVFDTEEAATALALSTVKAAHDLAALTAYTTAIAAFAESNDEKGLRAFLKAEAGKCTCADFANDMVSQCGMACAAHDAAEAASGSFASSAAAVVIAGLAAALY